MQKLEFLDTAPMGLMAVARDRQKLRCLYINKTMAQWLGLDNAAEKPLLELWQGKNITDIAKSLQMNAPLEAQTVSLVTANEGEKWIKLSVQETTLNGQDAYLLWADDISHDKEAESHLKQAIEAADAAAESKSNFLATMSHEMRTPMQSVFGLLELMELEHPPQNIMDMISTAKTSASGLLEILDDILDLAKIDADKMELDVFEVPLRLLGRGVLEAMSVKTHGKPIELKDEIDADVPFVVVGDPKRLRQILINLTGNAIKFTEKGSITLRINRQTKTIQPESPRLGLRFEITDTGLGMPEEVRKKLFQAFTQADSSTARKFGGTGLGLSICKKLVELMGGQIGVESEVGKGSTFWFEIPTEEVSVNANILELPKLDGISILSVEDHPQGAKEIANSLRSMGASVETCATYAEGLDLLKRRPFDVAVIDQGLPDGLGIDLIREALELRPFMGCIMYTVRDDAGLQHSLQSMGVKYLVKPASRLGLGEAVAEAAIQAPKMDKTGPTRLLIAEDTASVRDLLARQLKALGAEADFVENGQEALTALASGKYGILFTDLHMPEVDGYQLVETIRGSEKDTEKHLPVIVLTADVQMAQRQVYLSHGFDECLLKPVSLGHFKRLLIRWGLLKEAIESEETSQAPASIEVQEGAAIDKNAIIEQMGAFDENAIEMLGFFVDMCTPVLQRLLNGQLQNNVHEVKEAAHSLKGAARSACAVKLGDLASIAQDRAEKGQSTAEIVPQVEAEFKRVAEEIKTLSV